MDGRMDGQDGWIDGLFDCWVLSNSCVLQGKSTTIFTGSKLSMHNSQALSTTLQQSDSALLSRHSAQQ